MPVVVSITDNPLPLVKLLLPLISRSQIIYSLLPGQLVNTDKMAQQPRSLLTIFGKQDMLDIVAIPAQCLETQQLLTAGFFVVLPDFVAVQPALLPAYPTPKSCSSVDRPANPIPSRPAHQFGQAGKSRFGRYRLYCQFQYGHI